MPPFGSRRVSRNLLSLPHRFPMVVGIARRAEAEPTWREHWLAMRQACGYLPWRAGITI